jgi:hypothetical protein
MDVFMHEWQQNHSFCCADAPNFVTPFDALEICMQIAKEKG